MRVWRRARGADRIVSEVAASIAGSLDMATTLQSIAQSTRRVLGADRATCYVVSDEDQVSAVYTTEDDAPRRAFLESTVGLGPRQVPILRRHLAEEDPLMVVEDVWRDPRISGRLAAALGCGAFLGVRLEHHSVLNEGAPALLGTLFCSYGGRRRIGATERATARALAGLAALALANARLHSDTLRHLESVEEQAAANRHQALHDALTGLPNRVRFLAAVDDILASRAVQPFAVMMMDLDGFKRVNDALGHHNGDTLLQVVAERLRAGLRGLDTVARLGGDEFAILLPGVGDVETALGTGTKISGLLSEPVVLQELTVDVEASIGIALFPAHGASAAALLRRADVAMYVAKTTRSGQEVYSAEQDEFSAERLALMGELRGAIERDELVLHYQPKVDLVSGEVAGVEALVRWDHPTRGRLAPGEFIPMAERTALIRPLTLYVLDRALEQRRRWIDDGIDLPVAVNLPVRHLLDVTFPDEVAALLDKWGVDGDGLELEITETSLMSNPARALEVLSALRDLGVRIAIDDFGTGYSSLDYLKRLPADVIKIDKSFVLGMASNEPDAMIVRSTIDLARNLGLRVVAEGIETEAALDGLRALGCDIGQGFHLGRPVGAEDLGHWLRQWTAARAVAPDAGEAAPAPAVRAATDEVHLRG